jgi:TorA maturation chaperone TorD
MTMSAASSGSDRDEQGDLPARAAEAEHRVARARLLEVCSRLLLSEVDAKCLTALRDPALRTPLAQLEATLPDWLGRDPWSAHRFDEAAADFCELFVLSPGTSPCASAWLGDEPARIGAAFNTHVEHWCGALGLAISNAPLGRVPRDHVAVLLGLYAHATLKADEASSALAAEIYDSALAPWIPRFARAVLKKTRNPLYRAVARLLDQLLEDPGCRPERASQVV